MRTALALALMLVLSPACALLPDGSKAMSLEQAVAALQGVADDAGRADLNNDGLLQLDDESGAPIPLIQDLLRTGSAYLESGDSNGDGLLDGRELLRAAPGLGKYLWANRDSLELQAADGSPRELILLGLLLTNRLLMALD